MSKFTATAFMCLFNEADILPWTLAHLTHQGIGIYVVDNWSTDGSAEIAQRHGLLGFERFPQHGSDGLYRWSDMLHRVEVLAAQSGATWCIHHDADEIRRSPRAGERLIEALERVDREGYTAIDHQVVCFQPTNDRYAGQCPECYFTHYSPTIDTGLKHVKAWKNQGRVDLAGTGGHEVQFTGVRVHPEKFILKHYPIRTSTQGARKVLQDRMPRYRASEREMGWHVQYDELAVRRDWVKAPEVLTRWVEG